MADKMVKFTPIRGIEQKLDQQEIKDGQILFATDTGKIFTDVSGKRILLGNNGVAVFYANDPAPVQMAETEEEGTLFSLDKNYVENIENCHVNDLILNKPDGCFYQVLAIGDTVLSCQQLAVSGSGGGGGGGGSAAITLSNLENIGYLGWMYAYNQDFIIRFTPKTELTDYVALKVDVKEDGATEWTNIASKNSHRQNTPYELNAKLFPLSNNFAVRVQIAADAIRQNFTFENLSTVEINIEKVATSYTPIILPDNPSGQLDIAYIPKGSARINNVQIHVWIDGFEDDSYIANIDPENFNLTNHVYIVRQSHGMHTIELALSADINNTTIYTSKIAYKGAWASANDDTPIIWTGDYNSTIINYENAYIPFMVFDPIAYRNDLAAEVTLYKNSSLVNEMSLNYSTTTWAEWDISAIYDVGDNLFSIVCRGSKLDIPIFVTTEGARDLGLAQAGALLVNFSAAGRSNLEIKSNRSVWEGTDHNGNILSATLDGFNWQNNGWQKDAVVPGEVDSGSYLSLSNGASVSLPCPSITLNHGVDYAIEIRLRIRNVQKYSTLITNLPKYFYNVGTALEPIKSQTSETMAWIEDHGYTVFYDEYGSPLMDEENTEYFIETRNGVICNWTDNSGYGLVIGSQEAYFRNQDNIINVRYKENEVLNITCVVVSTSLKEHLAYIYLNGILSGANSLPANDYFTINKAFTFNSDYCDVDLYRFRVYNTNLTMPDVIHNYLSDIHSIAMYDQNQLTEANYPTLLSYNKLVQYNETHPDEPTMPYAVWEMLDLDNSERLPYRKGDNQDCKITFVNPPLDRALETGEIDEWYYYTHCPSFESCLVDINVQGTSSQKYPRRNFKTKFKGTTKTDKGGYWIFTKGSLAGESMNEEHTVLDKNGVEHTLTKLFHMDNELIGTNKFTWKIDYMESSGTYNTGFANLMGNLKKPLYTKHPLDDLGYSGDGLRTSVYGFPVLVFHKFNVPANNYTFPNKAYDYIGRYNLNLDKGSNEYFGYESKLAQPHIDGTPAIKNIAECWELRDNQGDWCSFKFPSAAAREIGFAQPQQGFPECYEVVKHFEYRYSKFGDELDAIGPGEMGGYTGTTDDEAIIAEIGTTDAEKSVFIRKTYYNLERLFYWLDSTNQEAATNGDIIIRQPVKNQNGTITISSTILPSQDYNTVIDYTGYEGATSVVNPAGGYITTFTKDTAQYRREKFRVEFDQHLDKEYCLVYFVMTELLLCYDSRGKNMMLATFGPKVDSGEYVWYPTFYDIDTQLGLNNSGAYLWDYDADVTEDGLFSTPKSVLWVNLYDVFNDDIKTKYRVLRGVDGNPSIVQGNLTYETITGAYECNGSVFDSYAMRGLRPTIAIGLDSYYKYIAPAITGFQYVDGGNIVIQDSPTYAYCAQGDKKLTTELLLKNRLNYIDSWWLAGSYEVSKVLGAVNNRINANRPGTSDVYLDAASYPSGGPNGYILANYPVPYFDGVPGYKLKPFLKQYVTYYFDKNPVPPVKYNGEEDGIWTNITAEQSYKMDNPFSQQINYIPGSDYLSSLGDLSLTYMDEFQIGAASHLLDLTLGSDIPGYYNDLLDQNRPFDLNDGATSNQPKSLLKKMVLSNLRKFNKSLDIRGSKKMQEFRALNTLLPSVTFADGAPLHTVHLPKSLNSIILKSNADLSNILTTKPKVAKWVDKTTSDEVQFSTDMDFATVEVEYALPEDYRGLYIEDVTDYDNTMANNGHALSRLEISGGNLGYGSYTLLKNLIDLKRNAVTQNTLAINLQDVNWTPYIPVEYGERYNSAMLGTYFYATDHSTFVPYTYTTNEQWNFDTLNGLIYTYVTNPNIDLITSLDLFQELIVQYTDARDAEPPVPNRFTNTSGDSNATMPTITGEVFINNDAAHEIEEADLTRIFKVAYPNLTIRAAHVHEANITKYVQVLDSGKTEVIEALRDNNEHPLAPTKDIPRKANYDFLGWSQTPNGELFIEYDNLNQEYIDINDTLNSYTFTEQNNILTLYAQFEAHKYDVNILDGDGSILRLSTEPEYNFDGQEVTMRIAAGQHPIVPTKLPYKAIADTTDNFYKAWRFIGYSIQGSSDIIDLGSYTVGRNVTFVSNFELINDVRTVVYPELFNATAYTYNDGEIRIGSGDANDGSINLNFNISGCKISPKNPNDLRGKITLPKEMMIDGEMKPVVAVGGFSSLGGLTDPTDETALARELTHVFLQDKENFYLREIQADSFNYCENLHYFDFSDSIRFIDERAFRRCSLQPNPQVDDTLFEIGNNIVKIGTHAFNNALLNRTDEFTIYLPNTLRNLYDSSFGRLNKIPNSVYKTLQIAPHGEFGSVLYFYPPGSNHNNWFIQNDGRQFQKVEVHLQGQNNLNNDFTYNSGIENDENNGLLFTDAQIYEIFGGNDSTDWHINNQGTDWTPRGGQ